MSECDTYVHARSPPMDKIDSRWNNPWVAYVYEQEFSPKNLCKASAIMTTKQTTTSGKLRSVGLNNQFNIG